MILQTQILCDTLISVCKFQTRGIKQSSLKISSYYDNTILGELSFHENEHNRVRIKFGNGSTTLILSTHRNVVGT